MLIIYSIAMMLVFLVAVLAMTSGYQKFATALTVMVIAMAYYIIEI